MTHEWHAIVAAADMRCPESPAVRRVVAAIRAVLEPQVRLDRPHLVGPNWLDLSVAAMRCGVSAEELCDLYLFQYRLSGGRMPVAA